MTPVFTNIKSLTQEQALVWLQNNDPEGKWSADDSADYVGAVSDNLRDFGVSSQTGPVIVSDDSYSELLEKLFDLEDSLRRSGFTQAGPGCLWKPPLGPSALPHLQRIDELTAQVNEAQKSAVYWKTMHDNQVARNKILRQRPDLPVDRIPAYNLVEWAHGLKNMLSEIVDAIDGVEAITNDSHGVAGYHLNGAIATWDSFEEIEALCEAGAKLRRQLDARN